MAAPNARAAGDSHTVGRRSSAAGPAGRAGNWGSGWARSDTVRGTIQRIDYRRREMRVIASGRVWEFVVATDCRLWFNDTPAVLRCFHPLDPVAVLYQDQEAGHTAKMIYSWEPQSAPWEVDGV